MTPFDDMKPETQAAFREMFAAIEKQYGPIESVHFCSSFEGSPEWKRLMEELTGTEEIEIVGGYPDMEEEKMTRIAFVDLDGVIFDATERFHRARKSDGKIDFTIALDPALVVLARPVDGESL